MLLCDEETIDAHNLTLEGRAEGDAVTSVDTMNLEELERGRSSGPCGRPGSAEGRGGPAGRHAAGAELQDPDIGDRLEELPAGVKFRGGEAQEKEGGARFQAPLYLKLPTWGITCETFSAPHPASPTNPLPSSNIVPGSGTGGPFTKDSLSPSANPCTWIPIRRPPRYILTGVSETERQRCEGIRISFYQTSNRTIYSTTRQGLHHLVAPEDQNRRKTPLLH